MEMKSQKKGRFQFQLGFHSFLGHLLHVWAATAAAVSSCACPG